MLKKEEVVGKISTIIEQVNNSLKKVHSDDVFDTLLVKDTDKDYYIWISNLQLITSDLVENEITDDIKNALKSLKIGWNDKKDLQIILGRLIAIRDNIDKFYLEEKKQKLTISKADVAKACNILADTVKGLSGSTIIELTNAYAEDFKIKVPYYEYPFNEPIPKNKKSALMENLSKFSSDQQIYILQNLCNQPIFFCNSEVLELNRYLTEKYGKVVLLPIEDENIIINNNSFLKNYAKTYNLFSKAISDYENGNYDRSVLDNARLALELLLKNILNNNKSLENQHDGLGKYLKSKNIDSQIRSVFLNVLSCYEHYQNDNIKHDDNVEPNEIKYILDLTNTMMSLLVKITEEDS